MPYNGSLKDLTAELEAKSRELHEIYAEAGAEFDMAKISFLNGDSAQKAAEIKRRNREINELGAEKERLENLVNEGRANFLATKALLAPDSLSPMPTNGSLPMRADSGHGWPEKSLKDQIKGDRGYQNFVRGEVSSAQLTFVGPGAYWNTLITLSDINVQPARRDRPIDMAVEERTVTDMMLQGAVETNTVEYYEETTLTNNAATVAEGATKPESAIDWTLRTEPVRKIATWIPATSEALADVSFLESLIRGRLAYMVRRVEENQVLAGDGVAPNLMGILNRTGIQTQAKATDPTPDAVYKAMQLVRGSNGLGFAEPTGIVFHPDDWTEIKLLRTTDGIYLWGNPSDEGPDRIWGKPVRQTTAMTEGTALVGAFRPYAEVLRRENVTVTLSTEHANYFIENKVAILAESRLALAVYRPAAFATVTGI